MTALDVAVGVVYKLCEMDKSRWVHCRLISFSYTLVAHCKAKWMVSTVNTWTSLVKYLSDSGNYRVVG